MTETPCEAFSWILKDEGLLIREIDEAAPTRPVSNGTSAKTGLSRICVVLQRNHQLHAEHWKYSDF